MQPPLTASKDRQTSSSTTTKNWILPTTLGACKQISPYTLWKLSSDNTFNSSLWDYEQRTQPCCAYNSDLWTKLISGYKPLSLWVICCTAIANQYQRDWLLWSSLRSHITLLSPVTSPPRFSERRHRPPSPRQEYQSHTLRRSRGMGNIVATFGECSLPYYLTWNHIILLELKGSHELSVE